MDPIRLMKMSRRGAVIGAAATALTAVPVRAFWEGSTITPQDIDAAAERMRKAARLLHVADEDNVMARLIWEEQQRWPKEHWRFLAAHALNPARRS